MSKFHQLHFLFFFSLCYYSRKLVSSQHIFQFYQKSRIFLNTHLRPVYSHCNFIVDIVLHTSRFHCCAHRSRNHFGANDYNDFKHAKYYNAKGNKLLLFIWTLFWKQSFDQQVCLSFALPILECDWLKNFVPHLQCTNRKQKRKQLTNHQSRLSHFCFPALSVAGK